MVTQLREATRRAAKEHRCGMCNGTISVGEEYRVSTNVFDGRVYDFRECTACAKDGIVHEVYAWAYSPSEGVDGEQAWEWAHEHRDHDLLGAAALAWLARNGCTCERCQPDPGDDQ